MKCVEEDRAMTGFDQNAYIKQYNKQNYARVCLQVPPKIKEEWQAKAKAEGMSLTAWLIKMTRLDAGADKE